MRVPLHCHYHMATITEIIEQLAVVIEPAVQHMT